MSSSRRSAAVVDAGLALVVLLFFVHVVLLGETPVPRDALLLHQPWRGYVLESLREGRIPEWWDGVGLGTPVAGNPLFGVTYPLTWLLAPFPTPWAVDLLFVLHVWIAGAGVARLSRRWGAGTLGSFVAGASFAAGGWATTMVVMGVPLLTVAWMPHVVAAVDDVATTRAGWRPGWRPRLRLAAFVAMLLLAGDPGAIVTTSLLAAALVLSRPRRLRVLGEVALAGLGGAVMASVGFVTAVAHLADSERAGGLHPAIASVWSFHPARALEWIWPRALGDPFDLRLHLARLVADAGARGDLPPHFTPSLHVGLPVLLLALLAPGRLRWLLGGVTLLLVLVALGEHTAFYAAWRTIFIPERFVRYPERHLAGVLVLWSALAGVGVTRVLTGQARAVRLAGAGAALLTAMAAAASLGRGALITWLEGLRPAGPMPVAVERAVDDVLVWGAVAALFAWLFCLAVWLAGQPRLARAATVLLPAAILGELAISGIALVPTLDRETALAPPGWLHPAPTHARPLERVYRDKLLAHVAGALGPAEVALVAHSSGADHTLPSHGVAEIPGYHPTAPRRVEAVWRFAKGAPLERLLDLFDVRWAILPDGDARGRSLPVVARSPFRYALHENRARRPRAFVAARWRWFHEGAYAAAALFEDELDFHAVRLEGRGAAPEGTTHLAPCALEIASPEEVAMRCGSPGGGYAVILDAWSPGWRATVDGAPAAILRAEALARAVAVPPGEHVVVWRYRTPGLRLAALASAAAWGVWLLLAVLTRRRSARAAAAQDGGDGLHDDERVE